MIVNHVKRPLESSKLRDEAVNGRWPLSGHKAEPHQKFAAVASSPISCISLHSHIIILDIVEEVYNRDPSLCIHLKQNNL